MIRRARRLTSYTPVREDWIWYAILPCGAWAALGIGALLLGSATRSALFATGAAALALLLIGIHNAWDTVTHIVVTRTSGGSIDPGA